MFALSWPSQSYERGRGDSRDFETPAPPLRAGVTQHWPAEHVCTERGARMSAQMNYRPLEPGIQNTLGMNLYGTALRYLAHVSPYFSRQRASSRLARCVIITKKNPK